MTRVLQSNTARVSNTAYYLRLRPRSLSAEPQQEAAARLTIDYPEIDTKETVSPRLVLYCMVETSTDLYYTVDVFRPRIPDAGGQLAGICNSLSQMLYKLNVRQGPAGRLLSHTRFVIKSYR